MEKGGDGYVANTHIATVDDEHPANTHNKNKGDTQHTYTHMNTKARVDTGQQYQQGGAKSWQAQRQPKDAPKGIYTERE